MTLTRKQFDYIMQAIKESEREGLEKLPPELALEYQTGYLLGFAACWNKIRDAVHPSLPPE